MIGFLPPKEEPQTNDTNQRRPILENSPLRTSLESLLLALGNGPLERGHYEVEPNLHRGEEYKSVQNQSNFSTIHEDWRGKIPQRVGSSAVPLRVGKSHKLALAQSQSHRVIAQGRLASGHLQYNTTVKLQRRDQLALLLAAPLRCLRTSIRGLAVDRFALTLESPDIGG